MYTLLNYYYTIYKYSIAPRILHR